MNAPLRTTLSIALLAASIGSLVAAPTQAATPTAKPIAVSDVVYSHEEMFGFNIQKYLSKRAPRLCDSPNPSRIGPATAASARKC